MNGIASPRASYFHFPSYDFRFIEFNFFSLFFFVVYHQKSNKFECKKLIYFRIDMSEDKEHRNYVMSHEEKPFARHVRHNNTRFITHPYSQQNIIQNLDTNVVQNDLNQIQIDHSQQMQNFSTISHQNLLQNQNIVAQNIDSRVKSNTNASRGVSEKTHTQLKTNSDANQETVEVEPASNTQESKGKILCLFFHFKLLNFPDCLQSRV